MGNLVSDLKWRGLIHDSTGDATEAALDAGGLTLYWGVDPTARSMHVGQLLGLMMLRRLQEAGHRPVLLAGGATGMIGDPSFKATERPLLDEETLATNVAGIESQLRKFVEFSESSNSAVLVNNFDWTKDVSVLSFLRDVGKHFTVNQMIARESVRARLADREQGISFTEFSYSLLQAFDYLHLFRTYGCSLQVGGSDQWGNILSGVELVRRSESQSVHAFSWPLVTKADGTKFGKSESGTVWLDAEMTSPYKFHQFFLRTEDAMVGTYLRYYTFLNRHEIEELDVATRERPQKREAQRRLADELTTTVHGSDQCSRAVNAAKLLFDNDFTAMDEAMLVDVFAEVPSVEVSRSEIDSTLVVDFAVRLGLSPSKSAARKAVEQGGVYLNGDKLTDIDATVPKLLFDRYAVVRRGKRDYGLVRFG
jgi:tyrosyl-tRNA synthetase